MKIGFNQIRGWRAVQHGAGAVGRAGVLVMLLAALPLWAAGPVMTLPAGASGAEIQQALDALPARGGAVVLPPGIFKVSQPIVLRRNNLELLGAGATTVLFLADNANCPVLILGEPVNRPRHTIRHLRVSDLSIDGNRARQQRELWRLSGEGSEIRNNGICIQRVSDSVVERVTCARCRSGGLVTTRAVRRLTVRDLTAFDNEFDGLACYATKDSLFTKLDLHDNPGAGISLDLDFSHNVVSNAVLTANDLGIFMRASRDNQFYNVSIHGSREFGVFMAQVGEATEQGWRLAPQSECARNAFTNLAASHCGGAAFRVNNDSCTNNVIIRPRFDGNVQGNLSLVRPDLVTVQ